MLPSPHIGSFLALGNASVLFVLGVDKGDIAVVNLGLLVDEVEYSSCARDTHYNEVELVGDLIYVSGKRLGDVEEWHYYAYRNGHSGNAPVGSVEDKKYSSDYRDYYIEDVAYVVKKRS